jgi:hypothetical protein
LAIDTSEKFQQLIETTPKHLLLEQEVDVSELKNLGT